MNALTFDPSRATSRRRTAAGIARSTTSRWRSTPAPSSPSSARAAAASRRCSTSPPACWRRRRARCASNGEPLTGLNRRATYMFQQDALLPWKTVRENVALGLTLGGVRDADAQAQRRRMAGARRPRARSRDHYPSQLSGGMRKRVGDGAELDHRSRIVLMDEPFSALDVHTRQRMESELLGALGRRPQPGRPSSSSRTIWRKRSRSPTKSSCCRPDRRAASSRATR